MFGSRGHRIPLEQRATGTLWLDVLIAGGTGVLLVYLTWPLLSMTFAHPTGAGFFLIGFIVLCETIVVRGLWLLAVEILRRRKQSRR